MEIPGGVLLSGFAALPCRQVVPLYSWLVNGPTSSIGAPSFRQLKLKKKKKRQAKPPIKTSAVLLFSLFKFAKDERREAQPMSKDSAAQLICFSLFIIII